MDKVGSAAEGAVGESTGFFKYVFAFDDEVKCQLGNMIQYGVLALLPVLGILKAVQHLVPEEDSRKGSVALGVESLIQITLVLVLMWLSDRVLRYIPTISGCAYGEFQPIAFLLPFLIILATMQTKLGAKLNLIVDRIIGDEEPAQALHPSKRHPSAGGSVRITQPLAGGHQPPSRPQHHGSQADTLDSRMLVPDDRELTSMPAPQVPSHVQPQRSPDFSQMYQNTITPLENAATPGGGGPGPRPGISAIPQQQTSTLTEPLPANEVLGTGTGSPW
jgi:hypothetical protein